MVWKLLSQVRGNFSLTTVLMSFNRSVAAHRENGVTMVEVLVAALLIILALGGIFAMNARSLQILRTTRQVTASSLMAQQRLETIRGMAWPEISNSTALATMMQTPAESEKELADSSPVETISISVPTPPSGGAAAGPSAIRVQRQRGLVHVLGTGDFGKEPMLLVSASVQWHDSQGTHDRTRRTVMYRSGLTRSGIFGSALGRPATAASTPAPSLP